MIAFDSNILIYVVDGNPAFSQKAVEVFLEIERVGGVCSSLIITESMHAEINSKEQLGPLLSPSVTIIPATEAVTELAGTIKHSYGLKNIDAIHVASALTAGAVKFVTNDEKLYNKKIIEGMIISGL